MASTRKNILTPKNGQFLYIINAINEYEDDYSSNFSFWDFSSHEHPHGWSTPKERDNLFKKFVLKNHPGKHSQEDLEWIKHQFAINMMSDFSESYAGQNTGFFFRKPIVIKDAVLIRFSNHAPSDWIGHEPDNLGLTFHESSGVLGTLSFAFLKDDLEPNDIEGLCSNYGSRIFEISVPEALMVEHISDGYSNQVIFDLDEIINIKELKSTYIKKNI